MNIVAASPSASFFNAPSSVTASVPYARLTLPQDQFGAKKEKSDELPMREVVDVDPEKVDEYLEMLKAFPKAAEKKFVRIFETQMTSPVTHIALAITHGLTDKHIGKLNGIILDDIKGRKDKNPEKAFAHKQSLSSLGDAQLQYLTYIGRQDLVDQYNAWDKKRR